MRCPFCGYEESKVINSRPTEEVVSIRRRRECLICAKRFNTLEQIESMPVMVIKKDMSREPFNRDKVLRGIVKACEKRPVAASKLENAVFEIEAIVYNSMEKEITTEQIGELVMDKLKLIDEVAYVRFASVYRQFKDINTFMAELNKLLTDK